MKTLSLSCEECGNTIGTIDVGTYPATLFDIAILCKECYTLFKKCRSNMKDMNE